MCMFVMHDILAVMWDPVSLADDGGISGTQANCKTVSQFPDVFNKRNLSTVFLCVLLVPAELILQYNNSSSRCTSNTNWTLLIYHSDTLNVFCICFWDKLVILTSLSDQKSAVGRGLSSYCHLLTSILLCVYMYFLSLVAVMCKLTKSIYCLLDTLRNLKYDCKQC